MLIGIALIIIGALISVVGLFIIGIPMALFGAILLVLNVMKTGAVVTAAGAKAAYRAATTKSCPDCKQRIPADALVCFQCKRRFDDPLPA